MGLNWFDIVLLAILLVALILGFIKGLVRQIIGIVAVIGGLVLAGLYYPVVARFFGLLISDKTWSNLLGFLIIFICILLVGWLLSFLISKLMRGPLKFLNHFLGGIFGFLKGVLICGVIVFAFLTFPVNKQALKKSRLAPYCYGLTKGAVYLVPLELKEKMKAAYQEIKGSVSGDGKKI